MNNFEQIPEAMPHETTAVTSHLKNNQSKTNKMCGTLKHQVVTVLNPSVLSNLKINKDPRVS